MEKISMLSDISESTQKIYRMSLSHIVATDFNTMIDLVELIREQEEVLKNRIGEAKTAADENEAAEYDRLLEAFEELQNAVTKLTAVSANQDNAAAYALANGAVNDAAGNMASCISKLREEALNQKDARRNALRTTYRMSIIITVFTILLSIIAVGVAVVVVIRHVIHPIERTNAQLADIISGIDAREGDLTKRIKVTSEDEIGTLGRGINSFMDRLQKIFTLIAGDSDKMEHVVVEVLGSIQTSNESATELSELTEKLSNTMGEVAGHANIINGDAAEVHERVSVIAEKTREISGYSMRMKEHADVMELSARDNMLKTDTKVEEILDILKQAIEDAGSVDRVKSLTDNILSISSQTNLLALNASIEAARAGEAGKGFAVVAEEISNLAASSREAASSIQEINIVITQAVHNLAEHSSGLVDYMRESILPEFSHFVEDSEKYRENAAYIESVMSDFETKTGELEKISTDIADAISTITSSINDGVGGINGAARSTQTLVNDMDNITRRMDENEQIAGELQRETSVFSKL